MTKIEALTDEMWETLKRELFMSGRDGLEDFLGFELQDDYDKDTVENELEDIGAQMPDEIQVEFYLKYVPNDNYVNDDGYTATICKQNNQYVAYVEPSSNKIGPFDFRDQIVHDLTVRGFYEVERA